MTSLGRPWRAPALLLAAAWLSACADDVSRGGETQLPTRMIVQPEDFLGPVPCLDAPGAMRSYQVTIFDVTPDLLEEGEEGSFPLPTSSIVPCELAVGFQYVAPGHRYVAQVAGFTAAADTLRQPAPGFPAVVDGRGRVVAPRWTTTCHGSREALAAATQSGDQGQGGQGGAPGDVPWGALAVLNAQVPIRGCEPLQDLGESPTGIVVRLDPTLSGLRCGDAPGEIASVTVEGADLPAGNHSAACGDAIVVTPLPAGQDVIVDVTARSAPGVDTGAGGAGGANTDPTETPATWVTRCQARTATGALVPASCDPLVPSASL